MARTSALANRLAARHAERKKNATLWCINFADRVETRCVAKTIPIWPIEMDERYRVIFQIAPELCCDFRGAAPFVAFVPQGTSRASQSGTTFTTNINASNGTRLSTRLML